MKRLVPELPLPTAARRPGRPRPTLPMPGDPARAFRYGVDLWNHRHFWEAHEVWEPGWRAEPLGPRRDALHGLIQAAAGYYAAAAGRSTAAARLAARASARLNGAVIAAVGGEVGLAAWQVAAALAAGGPDGAPPTLELDDDPASTD